MSYGINFAAGVSLVGKNVTFKLGDRAFSVAGPRVWNKLPTELKAITDIRVFRRKLKTFLFSAAYP